MKRKKPISIEDRIERELARVQKKLMAGKETNPHLYGAQQALVWLLHPEETGSPSSVL